MSKRRPTSFCALILNRRTCSLHLPSPLPLEGSLGPAVASGVKLKEPGLSAPLTASRYAATGDRIHRSYISYTVDWGHIEQATEPSASAPGFIMMSSRSSKHDQQLRSYLCNRQLRLPYLAGLRQVFDCFPTVARLRPHGRFVRASAYGWLPLACSLLDSLPLGWHGADLWSVPRRESRLSYVAVCLQAQVAKKPIVCRMMTCEFRWWRAGVSRRLSQSTTISSSCSSGFHVIGEAAAHCKSHLGILNLELVGFGSATLSLSGHLVCAAQAPDVFSPCRRSSQCSRAAVVARLNQSQRPSPNLAH